MLKNKHSDEEEQEMLMQLKKAGKLLSKAVADKTISYEMATYIKEYILQIFGHTIKESGNVNDNEEVSKAMIDLNETVTIIDYFAMKERAIAEGRAEGIAEGREEGMAKGRAKGEIEGKVKGMGKILKKLGYSKNEAVTIITDELGISVDDIQKYTDEIWSE